MRRALVALTVLAALAPAAHAVQPRTTLNDVESQLMCDTCNVALSIADSPRATQERNEIKRLIAQGKTEQEILDTFEAEYGPNVLADPKGGSSATASWLVPAVALVLALLCVALVLRHWRRRRRTVPAAAENAPALSADDEARLERDLALYD